MTNTPTVAWFWPNPGMREWVPTGEQYRIVVGRNEPAEKFLSHISVDALVQAARTALAAR
jgi:hypothetical protein